MCKKLSGVGAVLYKDFMKPLGVITSELAFAMQIHNTRIQEVITGHRRITANTALRLAKYFGNDAEFWLAEQAKVDLALERPIAKEALKKIKPHKSVGSKERKTAKKNEGK
jgi:addiction module HigA family antidote